MNLIISIIAFCVLKILRLCSFIIFVIDSKYSKIQ